MPKEASKGKRDDKNLLGVDHPSMKKAKTQNGSLDKENGSIEKEQSREAGIEHKIKRIYPEDENAAKELERKFAGEENFEKAVVSRTLF